MKNFLKLFGITALVAVIGFTMVACGGGGGSSSGSSGGSLNGLWERNGDGTLVTINGNSGVITQGSNSWSILWRDASNKGYVKVGDRIFRNLRKTGDWTWEGQELAITSVGSAPNVAIGIDWYNTRITMNTNQQRFSVSTTRTGGGTTNTSYTKRQ